MPRSLVIVRALVAASVALVALTGCTQSAAPVSKDSCTGMIEKVLLTDDSATNSTTFDPSDVPKIFNVAATPVPTCYYKTVTTPPASNGVSYTVTHRTLLYIGLSDADAAALVAAVRTTASVAPWTLQYDNPAPAPAPSATPPATAAPTPESVSSSANWDYNVAGPATDDKGDMGYYSATPVAPGTATHAGLSTVENVVRIETELRQVKK